MYSRAARGGVWLGSGLICEQGLRLARFVVLTRLLTPGDFGQFAIIMAVSAMFQVFTEVGVKQCVIQHELGDTPAFLNAAWWVSVARGLGFLCLGLLAAPLVSRFYNDPKLSPLLAAAFLAGFLQFAASPKLFGLEKQLRFPRIITVAVIPALIATIISIYVAYVFRTVYALVWGILPNL